MKIFGYNLGTVPRNVTGNSYSCNFLCDNDLSGYVTRNSAQNGESDKNFWVQFGYNGRFLNIFDESDRRKELRNFLQYHELGLWA